MEASELLAKICDKITEDFYPCDRPDCQQCLPVIAIIEQAKAQWIAEGMELAAVIIQRRMDERFEEHGTREPDTNACFYSGQAGETYEALDEEADELITAIRAAKGTGDERA